MIGQVFANSHTETFVKLTVLYLRDIMKVDDVEFLFYSASDQLCLCEQACSRMVN